MESIFKTVSKEDIGTAAGVYQNWAKGQAVLKDKENRETISRRIAVLTSCIEDGQTPDHLIEGIAQERQQLQNMLPL